MRKRANSPVRPETHSPPRRASESPGRDGSSPAYAKKTSSSPGGGGGSPLRVERGRGEYARRSSVHGPLVSRRNSKACSFAIVILVTFTGCLFFPLFVTVSFIVLLNRKVAALIPRSSDAIRISAQLVACLPFYFAGPVLLTICAAVQILFSAYHSAASEFLLISFCLPFVFTSPWWGSWWYLCYVPAAVGVPLAQLAWRTAERRVSPVWQKWSFEKGPRARAVTLVNSVWRSVEAFIEGAGTSFPFLKYIRGFLRETFA